LLEDLGCLFFCEIFVFDYGVEEFTTLTDFRNQIHVPIVLEIFIEFEHVWMIKLLENRYFLLEPIHIFNLLPLDLFYCSFLASYPVFALADNAICSGAQRSLGYSVYIRDYFIILTDHGSLPDEKIFSASFSW